MTNKQRIMQRFEALEARERQAKNRTREIRQRHRQHVLAVSMLRHESVWSDGSVGEWRSQRADDGTITWISPRGVRGVQPPPELRRTRPATAGYAEGHSAGYQVHDIPGAWAVDDAGRLSFEAR